MSVGNGMMQMPSFDEIMAQMEGFDITPEFLDALGQYIQMKQLELMFGQQQIGLGQIPVQMEELGVRSEEAAARQAEVAFRQEYELPFRREEMENARLLAELGLTTQRERAEFDMQRNAEELLQLQNRGFYQTESDRIAMQTAQLNLARQREAFAHEKAANMNPRRGQGQYTPRSGY